MMNRDYGFIALNYIYLQVSTRPLRVPQPMVRSEYMTEQTDK